MTWLCLRNDDYRNSQMCIVTTSKLLEKQKHQAVEELAAAAEADNDQSQMKCIQRFKYIDNIICYIRDRVEETLNSEY
jgi:hypothetical protein